ncbi:MAG: cystathionine beta-lyase [Caulobacterales bacterium]
MAKKNIDLSKFRPQTRLAIAGRDPARFDGAVNPPIHRASTIVIPDADDLYDTPKKTYALEGMAVQEALRDALISIEGGSGATLAPSGLAACTLALLACTRAGGEVLVTDSCYGPTRRFCNTMLKRMGVETRYFDPRIGGGIEALMSEKTCAVFLESPGSLTFEIQDVPAITGAAKAHGIPAIIDNTWSAGVYFKPFEHGCDLSVQALTKYQAGHADVLIGAIVSANPEWAERIRMAYKHLGLGVSPDDAYLALRGLRTMHVRLAAQSAASLTIAQWLISQPQVARVLHPALSSHPDHELWKRDFSGASGVFGVILQPCGAAQIKQMLEEFALFAMGFSWGGYESLIVPCDENIQRSATTWEAEGPLLRLSVGLEDPADLIDDLAAGLAKLS